MRVIFALLLLVVSIVLSAQNEEGVKLARVQYSGGGDWYTGPTSLPNLAEFCNKAIGTNISIEEDVVQVGSTDLFNYSFSYLTGHGNIILSIQEATNLRNYLLGGGFLFVNDSYGMDKFIRTELKKVFPDKELVDLPYDHPIFNQEFEFKNGVPKIHEHDGNTPRGLGIVHEGRLVVFYNYEADLGDGWEDQSVHNDLPEIREKALQLGANIIQYVFNMEEDL